MGALYHLKQKLVDFCNVIQENVSRTDTVPSSKVVYDLSQPVELDLSSLTWGVSYDPVYSYAYRVGKIAIFQIKLAQALTGNTVAFSGLPTEFRPRKYSCGIITSMNVGAKTARAQISMDGTCQTIGVFDETTSYFVIVYPIQ